MLKGTLQEGREFSLTHTTKPLQFPDNHRTPVGEPCWVMKKINGPAGLPTLYEVKFSNGALEYVREEDLEQTKS